MSVMRTGAMGLVQLAVSLHSSISELRQQWGLCMGLLFELVPHAGCVTRAASDLAEVGSSIRSWLPGRLACT